MYASSAISEIFGLRGACDVPFWLTILGCERVVVAVSNNTAVEIILFKIETYNDTANLNLDDEKTWISVRMCCGSV